MGANGVMESREVKVEGRPATVHVGGRGAPVLLVHGGWGGAALHWGRVWERLAERFQVVAPELPGVGRPGEPGPGSVKDYARWMVGLLEALELPAAACVGNSFGAAVVWTLAAHHPARCRGLVLVNGTPLPPTPGPLVALGTWPPTRRLLLAFFRRYIFSPRAEALSFADPQRLPAELRAVFRQDSPPQLEALFDALGHGGDGVEPREARPLLLWGQEDRFSSTDERAARRLHARLPGSRLALIPGAGHLPQLEKPEAFLDALVPFLEAHTPPSSPSVRSV
jgi:pimeloyl-ACP methyl ester carboxylesterase